MVDKFIKYLYEQLNNHSIYVWGAQGQAHPVITEQWIRKRETSEKNAKRAIAYWKKQVKAGYKDVLRAFDCSGLGVYFFLENKLIENDMSANSLMRRCKKISFDELSPGDFVFKLDENGRAHHIGYIVDKNLNVIEAKGRDHGVMKSPFKNWDVFGRPDFLTVREKSRVLSQKTPYMRGDDVLELQKALSKFRFSPGKLDGIFGARTDRAVRAFQASRKLVVDGKAGAKTFAALGLEYVR